jgi:hypothetical protein
LEAPANEGGFLLSAVGISVADWQYSTKTICFMKPWNSRFIRVVRLFVQNHRKCLSMNNLRLFPRVFNQAQSSLIKPNQA